MSGERSMPLQTRMRLGFGVFLVLVFGWAGWEAWDFATLARYMPLFIGVVGVVLGVVTIATDLLNYRRGGSAAGDDVQETAALAGAEQADEAGGEGAVEDPRMIVVRAFGYFGVVLAYIAAIYFVGIFLASGLFLVLFLRVIARTGWLLPAVGVVAVLGAMFVLENLINVLWPPYVLEGLLGDYVPG